MWKRAGCPVQTCGGGTKKGLPDLKRPWVQRGVVVKRDKREKRISPAAANPA